MENVMTNGFTELSENEMFGVDGGWDAGEFFSGVGLVATTLVGAAVAVATVPVTAPAGLCAAIVLGSCASSFSGGAMIGDSFWH